MTRIRRRKERPNFRNVKTDGENDYDDKKDSWSKYAQEVLYSSIVKDSMQN